MAGNLIAEVDEITTSGGTALKELSKEFFGIGASSAIGALPKMLKKAQKVVALHVSSFKLSTPRMTPLRILMTASGNK